MLINKELFKGYFKQFMSNKEVWKKVIKCTIAYEIGTIIALIPQVYNSKGIVPFLIPLGTLFFNASGTAGNQIAEMLLDIIIIIPVCIWCSIISYLCTIYNKRLAEVPSSSSLYSNGAGVIASIAFFICLFAIGYLRMKYPRLAIATLIGSVVPFFSLTKGIYKTEFSIMSIVGIFYPTLIGGGIALLINLTLWPETAAKASEISFGKAFISVQNVLEYLNTHVFSEECYAFEDRSVTKQLRQNINQLDADISRMKRAKNEAKYEIVLSYYCPTWYKPIANKMEDLSRHFFGLMLAFERESQIITQQRIDSQSLLVSSNRTHENSEYCQRLIRMRQDNNEMDGSGVDQGSSYLSMDDNTTNKLNQGEASISRVEYKLISHLQSSIQPEMKKFFQTSLDYIKAIRCHLEKEDAIQQPIQNKSTTHKDQSYNCRHKELECIIQSLQEAKIILQNEYEKGQNPKVTEDHYLIYTVLFSLSQIGEKLFELEKEATKLIQKRRYNQRFPTLFFPKVPFKKWLGKASYSVKQQQTINDQILFDQQGLLKKDQIVTSRSSSNIDSILPTVKDEHFNKPNSDNNSNKQHDSNILLSSGENSWVIGNEKIITSLHNAPGTHWWNKWLYAINGWMRGDSTRYALKYAIIMELLALMAWLPIQGVNDLYNENHGQWALLSAMIVVNFTVGSTVLLCFLRTIATVIGAVLAYISLLAANRNENPYVLSVLTLVFQVPLWYIMLARYTYSRMGFIALLTMAVVMSTGYINTIQEDLFEPVWKRTLTAIFAIMLVLIIDQLLWPVWARKMMRRNLSDLLIATGIQFSKVASLVSQEDAHSYHYRCTLQDVQRNTKRLRGQYQLTSQMLVLAGMEPRLTKGKFPIAVYQQILHHEQNMLYWIEHLLTTQSYIPIHVRRLLIHPINPLRKELAAAVHLYLFILAGALRTKSPLPASLPSAELARQILQRRITQIMHTQFNAINGSESSIVAINPNDSVDTKTNNNEEANNNSKRKKEQQKIRYAENQIYWQTFAAGNVELIIEQEAIGTLVAKLMGQHTFKVATSD
ncbi:uncharacterized protein BX663DRAFT_491781 [Cokeromyces recurvatus]|uniref:uncharacterized protein n=1 Tax=Cokeromyces recurvatus TaxID=90255 RepID=UPI00221EE509|nr:uncharacterized protein BX663DRAFT_491781 [Cokeromyces recurvatus]KAI7907703.1 hypothetical protein BX663DRAFT_491781 [Cokeromyces recurvatus]